MNLLDLDPHLHFHKELLLYLDLAPDPFMLQPLRCFSLDLIPFRQDPNHKGIATSINESTLVALAYDSTLAEAYGTTDEPSYKH